MSEMGVTEARYDDGSTLTVRSESGQLWRVAGDAGDGTLALEEIDDYGGGATCPQIAEYDAGECAIARWNGDGTLTLFPVTDVGENHCEPKRYDLGSGECLAASTQGWRHEEE